MRPGLERKPIVELTATAAARAMMLGFEHYFVPVTLDAAGFDTRFRAEDLDACASHVYTDGGDFAGIVLVARRGSTSRIAAMGIAVGKRGRGLGQAMLGATIDDARARGDRRLLLEVIAANSRAIALYRRHGFRAVRDLLGFTRPASAGVEAPALAEIDPPAVALRILREGANDLPWQIAPETLMKAVAPARGLALGDRCVALVAPAPERKLSLRALYVPPVHRRRGASGEMLAAISRLYPDRAIATPIAIPAPLAPVFTRHGFQPIAISQHEMALDLL